MSSESDTAVPSVAAKRPTVPAAPAGSAPPAESSPPAASTPPPVSPPPAASTPPAVSPPPAEASAAADTPPSQADIASGAANPYGLPEIAVQRPEVAAGAAFAGGLVLAQILKRLAR